MKRAQTHEVGAAFFQLHMPANDVHHIGTRQQFLNKSLRDRHTSILTCYARQAVYRIE